MTVSVPSDSNKQKTEPNNESSQTTRKNKRNFRGRGQGNKKQPTTNASRRETERVCGGVEAYSERSLSVKYRNQGVQTSFYESTPSTRNPVGNTVPTGPRGNSGHEGTNIPNVPEERDNGASRLPRILLQRIPGMQSFRRVASSDRFKKSERSYLRTSFSYVHYKLSSEYRQKRRLPVQNRSAGCILSHTNTSKQQEVSQVCLRKQNLSIPSTSFRSEHSPSGIYSFGAYRDRLPPSSWDFGYSISR